MDALLRELREGPDGIAEYYDTEITSKALTLGSAADRNIQLLGRGIAPEHAVIVLAGSQLMLECRRGEVVLINGKKRASARLKVGDVVELAGHRLRIAQPPPGFNTAIELQPNDRIDASAFESAFRTDLAQTWLGKRVMAWTGVVLVVLFGLALPFFVMKLHHAGTTTSSWIPGDKFWNSGPLHQVHQQAIGDRCETCHQKLFQRVQDAACTECHRTTHDHIMPARLALTELGPTPRCATCHREHNEPQTFLVNSGDSMCVDCHGDPKHGFGQIELDRVLGFGLQRHPEFKPQLLVPTSVPAGGGSFTYEWKTLIAELDEAKEQSNLKFSHQQHLDPNQVLGRDDSQPLNCADCHRLEPDGEHFAPISMEGQCSSCHELTFDPGAPDRQLPHGKPREVVLTLQDYFTRKFSDPNAGKVTRERRRLPGHDDEEETCTGAPFDCAMRSARKEIESQFTRRGCIGCHAVIDNQAPNVFERFTVIPIRFARDYYPENRFDHRSHQIQNKLTGDDACLSCHAAQKSEDSSDLMVPGITKCTECHGDKAAAERVTVQCVSCHEYHPRDPSLLDIFSSGPSPRITTRLTPKAVRPQERSLGDPAGTQTRETKGAPAGELAGS